MSESSVSGVDLTEVFTSRLITATDVFCKILSVIFRVKILVVFKAINNMRGWSLIAIWLWLVAFVIVEILSEIRIVHWTITHDIERIDIV